MSLRDTLSTASAWAVTRRGGGVCWADLIAAHIGQSHVTEAVGSEDGFRGKLKNWRFGELSFVFSAVRGASVRGIQTTDESGANLHDVWLCLCLSGSFELETDRSSTIVDPSRMAVMSCGRPHVVTFSPDCDVLWVRAPRHPFGRLRRSDGRLIVDASYGIGQLARSSLTGMFREADRLDGKDSDLIVNSTLGLISAAVKQEIRDQLVPGRARRQARLEEIKAFIDRRLGDESLCLQSAAAALGSSPRQLNRLFESEGTSFMKWTWNRRLERAYEMVVGRDEKEASITDIALDCGFTNLSHFSRVFRERYGRPPSSLRPRFRDAEGG